MNTGNWKNMQPELVRRLWAEARKHGSVPGWVGVSRTEAAVIRAKWADRARTRQEMAAYDTKKTLLERWAVQPRIQRIAGAVLEALPTLGYAMGSSYSVRAHVPGIGQTVSVAGRNTWREYAKCCKWQARHGSLIVRFRPWELAHTRIVGGIITIARRWPRLNHKTDVVPCTWVEFLPGGGKELIPRMRSGYLCQTSHAETREQAATNARAVRIAHVAAWQTKRSDRRRKLNSEAVEAAKLAIYGNRIAVDRAASYAVGNCEPGTEAWIKRAGLSGDRCMLGELAMAIMRTPSEKERAKNVLSHVLGSLPLVPARMCDVAALT